MGRALKKAFSNFGNIRVRKGFFNEMIKLHGYWWCYQPKKNPDIYHKS